MRKIVFTRPDGGITVVYPVINNAPVPEDITEAEAEQRAWDRLPSTAINPHFVVDDYIPSDRTFRDAWRSDGKRISCDMNAAKRITKERLRRERIPIFAELDGKRAVAIRAGKSTILIDGEAQRLADITKLADKAETLEELKSICCN